MLLKDAIKNGRRSRKPERRVTSKPLDASDQILRLRRERILGQ
jgi:hypothetical protein